jgi:hypothetical protein
MRRFSKAFGFGGADFAWGALIRVATALEFALCPKFDVICSTLNFARCRLEMLEFFVCYYCGLASL